MSDLSRRDLLKGAALAGASIAAGSAFGRDESRDALRDGIAEHVSAISHPELAPPAPAGRTTMRAVPFERHETVRIGMVGTGLRGRSVLAELLALDNVRVVAICDVVPDKMAKASKMMTDAGQPAPALYGSGDHAFEQLVQRDDIDFVYTATPWEWHVPVMLAALNAGKHCGSECPIGTTLKDLWALVDTSERARRHCLHLENCCYGETEMLVNRMVHTGVFGDVLHAEAAYLHDLREILFEDRDEGLWRRAWHTRVNANLYPTHGLGPVAWYLDIHAGDRFDYIASVAGPERGLDVYREATRPDHADPKWRETYVTGDHHTSLIRTVKGKTIMLQYDVCNPRPYSRLNRVQGTKGAFEDYPPRVYVEGQKGGESWAPIDSWKATHTHPLWANIGELARKNGGHGGMDFVMAYRLVQCLHEGLVPDYDVYDAAAWSAPFPLTEMSEARGSAPMQFPDFTRGDWQKARA